MFYLSSVELGGRTGFPFLDLAVQPEEGSALFWYNLHPDGTFDERVVHAGCPVLLGSKWIATKWIYSDAQMFLRKCSPDSQKGFNPWFYAHYDF
ncbi:unnamed protein product [Allacma fusca]|uniref:Prolyl 4-hydroxylase alpha subunit Fe(2+) 2OG dioxygenase domain-containing protein n=1 Tax=Allacma fusca TaxID=39272 RepID=A0A8J2JKG3_9HEXA|nr:unnamed protein product [Allacma fusca]